MATQSPITVQPNPPTLLPVLEQGNASRFTRDAPPISSSRQGNPPTSRSGSNLSKAKRHSMPNFNLKLMSRLRQPDFPTVSVSPASANTSSSTPPKALEVTFTNPPSTMNAVTHSSVLSPMVFMDRADSTASVESVESSGSSRISSNSTNSGQSTTTSATTGNLHPSTTTLAGLRTKIIDGLPFIPPPRRRSFTSSGTSSSGTEDREFDRDSPFASELATPVDELGGTNSVFVASGKSNCQSGITMIRRRACGNASTDVGSQGESGSGCSSGGSSAGVTYYGEAALTERLGKKRRSSSFLPIFPRAQSWNFGLRAASAETKEDKKVEEVKSQVTVMTVPAGTVGTVTDTVLTEKIREKDSKGSGVKIAAAKTAVRVRVKVKEAKERLLHGSHKVPLGGDLLSAGAAGVVPTEGVTPNLPSVPPNTPVPPINSDATKAEEAQVKTPPTSKPPSPKRRSRGNHIYYSECSFRYPQSKA
ncbi:hypothetical protein BDN72DRAFT_304366 [Pluteus cervinus]|uniref:Uncharacterized protein n=1 Tax=Pluteus cervinus TaxID=181527 RepID=A0ACD3B435_9AGAR|nr:hypothetical protein BDN72DRAFT_304366 [Pluteus cervinus]